ncbi:class I SAM-dependent methyltransferase [Gammaproteobacteria bacterium]|nr:class I SAM-dependent methyltransferase [Gammaproteobacteria bacterium]
MTDKYEWLHTVRRFELDQGFRYFPEDKNKSILEIGSGTGFQLNIIEKDFKNCTGIEVKGSSYEVQNSKITEYDGKSIPFDDKSFDVVFSSNVLEHIRDIDDYNKEIHRVLKDNGICVHILPSSSWRFWTSLMHYPLLIITLTKILIGLFGVKNNSIEELSKHDKNKIKSNLLFSEKHGERGNVLTEHYYFSEKFWRKSFELNNWEIESIKSTGLFYWGRDFLKLKLSILTRIKLSRLLGSSTKIYHLRKRNI